MKQIIMALVITTFTWYSADAQTKTTKKCNVSADGKTVTCCKTTANPAYKGNKTALAAKKPVAKTVVVNQTSRNQICKEHGGSYTCCQYKHTKKVVKTTAVQTPVAQTTK